MKLSLVLVIFLISFSLNAKGLKEYYLYCSQTELDEIYKNAKEDIYIDATLKYNDKEWVGAKLRIRGDGSREYPKKSLKILFNNEYFENGNDVLNLNSEWTDKTYMRQFMASQLFIESGFICFESELVAVYLNDQFYGIYLAVENMDKRMYKKNGIDSKGNLYKAKIDGASLSINDEVYIRWQKKTNENQDRLDLVELIDSLYYTPDEDYYDYLKNNFEYESLINFMAMTIMITNKSTYTHNYFMYNDINNTKLWNILPWDMDKSFNYAGWWFRIDESSTEWFNDNPLLERGMINPKVRADIRKRCKEINDQFFINQKMTPRIDSLKSLLEPYIDLDKTDDIENKTQWEEAITNQMEYFEKRFDEVETQFDRNPGNFTVEKVFDYVFDDKLTISWTPSVSGYEDEDIEYIFSYGPKPYYDNDESVVTEGIVDTFFTMENLEPNEKYYYMVVSKARRYTVGWDSRNFILTKEKNELPCEINNNMTLNKDGSPYIINCNIVINKNAKLTLDAGVEIFFEGEYSMTVKGELNINGTNQNKVTFLPMDKNSIFLDIVYDNAQDIQNINNCVLNETSIRSENTDMNINNLTMNIVKYNLKDRESINKNNVLNFDTGNLNLKNSIFRGNYSGEGVLIWNGIADIDNCNFFKFTDPLEFINMPNGGSITNSTFIDHKDDAIDLNQSANVLVMGNFISNCTDKGISAGHAWEGSSENIIIKNNVIVNTNIAIAVKGNIFVNSINNNLISSGTGIMVYKKEGEVAGGGNAKVENCIFYDNKTNLFVDAVSKLDVSYSLSNSSNLGDYNNINADPKFKDFSNLDFTLMSDSPCIDTGNPNIKDADGTDSDIGAYYFNQGSFDIIFNEINYNSSPDYPVEDWIELYNKEDVDIDLSNWVFKDKKEDNSFIFPPGSKIKSKEYLVLVRNENTFSAQFDDVDNLMSSFSFGLGNGGDILRLYNNMGLLIDDVEYDDVLPWVEMPDGNGPTLELINPYRDNSLAINWSYSDNQGSPGRRNDSYLSLESAEETNNLSIYPNPARKNFNVIINKSDSIDYLISISDIRGRDIIIIDNFRFGNNKFHITNIKNSGVYFVKLFKANKLIEIKKIIIL